MKKLKHSRQIPHGAILVTADVVGLYPSIPQKAVLEILWRRLNVHETSEIPTEDIVQIAEFVLKSKIFEFIGEFKRQKSRTAIDTKFAPPYACVFINEIEMELLKNQELQSFLWLRYIDAYFYMDSWNTGIGFFP